MTAGVALAELVPGDQVIDLVAAGTVEAVEPILRTNGRESGALKVLFIDGTFIAGPATWTVITARESVNA